MFNSVFSGGSCIKSSAVISILVRFLNLLKLNDPSPNTIAQPTKRWQLIAGTLADRYGRRPCVLTGLWMLCACALLCVSADNPWQLNLTRVLQGFALAPILVASRASVRDRFRAQAGPSIMFKARCMGGSLQRALWSMQSVDAGAKFNCASVVRFSWHGVRPCSGFKGQASHSLALGLHHCPQHI